MLPQCNVGTPLCDLNRERRRDRAVRPEVLRAVEGRSNS